MHHWLPRETHAEGGERREGAKEAETESERKITIRMGRQTQNAWPQTAIRIDCKFVAAGRRKQLHGKKAEEE